MTTYTNEEVIAAARAAVEEKGVDYIYPQGNCNYGAEDGTPSCIVGNIINRLDPEAFKAVVQWERRTGQSGEVRYALEATRRANRWIELTETQISALQVAQNYQDDNDEWGRALRMVEGALS